MPSLLCSQIRWLNFLFTQAFGSSQRLWGLIELESPGGSALLFPDEEGETGAETLSVLINKGPPLVIALKSILTILINHLCHWGYKQLSQHSSEHSYVCF